MPKLVTPLTNTAIKNAKPKEKAYELNDGEGLQLRIATSGRKAWILKYQRPIDKKRTNISLGVFPEISLAEARVLRTEYKELLMRGIDPNDYRKQTEEVRKLEHSNTFKSITDEWRAVHSSRVKPETIRKAYRRIEKHLFPTLADLPVVEMTVQDFAKALKLLEASGKLETVTKICGLINQILNFAVHAGYLTANPCIKLRSLFRPTEVRNNPTVRPEELPELMQALLKARIEPQTRIAIQFQILTMTRPIEAVSIEWIDINFERKEWVIPAKKMKMQKEHVIPLSSQALALLKKQQYVTAYSRYVFMSAISQDRHMNVQTLNSALSRNGYKGKQTAHGLRALASTYLNEREVNADVIEACLAHIVGGGGSIRAIYNRATYLEQRREVMQIWGDYVEQCATVNILD